MRRPAAAVLMGACVGLAQVPARTQVQSRVLVEVVEADSEVALSPVALELSARNLATAETVRPLATTTLKPGTWLVSVNESGYWAPEVPVVVHGDTSLRIRVWRTRSVRFSITSSGLAKPPAGLGPILEFRGSSEHGQSNTSAAIPPSRAPCVSRAGALVCDLPRAVLDLKLWAPGHASAYWWGLRVGDLGDAALPAALHPGSSVYGFVTGLPPAGKRRTAPTVELRGALGEELRSPPTEKWSKRAAQNGFFQLVRVPPGEYTLVVIQGPFQVSQAVSVPNDSEVFAGRWTLGPPLTLRLELSPPVTPDERPWSVELLQMREQDTNTLQATLRDTPSASETGLWEMTGLAPGRYVAVVVDPSSSARVAKADVELRESETIRLQIRLVKVRGSLRLGQDPVVGARVAFGGAQGIVSTAMDTDDDGLFEGYIAQERPMQRWPVSVSCERPRLERRLEDVEVVAADGLAQVDIALPLSLLRGVVRGPTGDPYLGAARVAVRPLSGAGRSEGVVVLTMPPGRGEFQLEGLPAGHYAVSASAGGEGLRSAETKALLDKETSSATVRLFLRPATDLVTTVLDSAGEPIVGARVKVMPLQTLGAGSSWQTTGRDGAVVSALPPGTAAVTVSAAAVGYSFELQSHTVGEHANLPITLHRIGGTLVLDGLPTQTRRGQPFSAVFRDGGVEWIGGLREWAMAAGAAGAGSGRLTVPSMAVGKYAVCVLDDPALALLVLSGEPAALSRCATGALAAGETLELRIPQE